MRIIAGKAKGRTFTAPGGRSTRPTLDRVREAMFGMIQFDVEGAAVLDLFAGSGGLGLEALSRGADMAVFNDSDRNAARLIEKNLASLGLGENAEVYCLDCFQLIAACAGRELKFSIVLLDPPYASGLYEQVFASLASAGVLEDGCIILAEHSAKMPLSIDLPCFLAGKPHRYGDVAVTKFIYRTGSAEPSLEEQ